MQKIIFSNKIDIPYRNSTPFLITHYDHKYNSVERWYNKVNKNIIIPLSLKKRSVLCSIIKSRKARDGNLYPLVNAWNVRDNDLFIDG